MKVYLMRHGEASFDASDDNMRSLTDNGRLKIRCNLEKKLYDFLCVDRLLSSPILRARQTAELVRTILGRSDEITEVEWLLHESMPSTAIARLSELDSASVMLFSHQPFASRFVEALCGLEPGEIVMNTASIIAMEADPVAKGFGKILWQMS